jgi:predicted site-specific integrase-resolvase
MDKQVLVISADSVRLEANQKPRKLRVAAYCRVSTEEERQLDSFENQVEHYEQHIAENSAYELVGIYSDEGLRIRFAVGNGTEAVLSDSVPLLINQN